MPRRRIQGSGSGLGQAYAAVLAAQRGPLESRRSSGGRRSSTSQRAKGSVLASQDLQRTLQEIQKKQGGGGFLDGITNAAKSGFKGALDALDTPRAAVLSIGKELGDLAEDGEFSFNDLVKQTRDNYSFGEFLDEEVAQTHEWNPALRFAAGLAGDIAIDPLSYLAPGAKIAELGPKGVAENLLRSATDDVARQGIEHADDVARAVGASEKGRAAARVGKTRSVGSLSDEMRAAGGVAGERGVYLNAPGTGRIGRRFKIDKAVDVLTRGRYGLSKGDRLLAKQIRLGGGKGASALHETLMRPVAWAANKATSTARFANGADAGFREMFRSGDPELAVKGFHGLEASAAGRLQDRRFAQEFSEVADQLIHDARKADVDMADLHLAAAGDGPAIKRITDAGHADIVERARAFFDDAAITANQRIVERGGQEIISMRDDYAPRILTDEAREAKGIKQGPFPKKGKRTSVEKARKYVAGESLFGKTLVEPAEHPQGWSVERQMDQILADHGVDDGWFQTDASKTFPMYARLVGRRVGQETTAGMLTQRGLGEFAFGYTSKGQQVMDARAQAFKMSEAARRRGRIARGELGDAAERLATGQADAGARAGAAKTASADARRAAQEAAAAVDEAHPGVEAIREYADHWDAVAEETADGLRRYMDSVATDVERTSTERAMAHAEALAVRGQRDRLATKINDLKAARDEAWDRAARLWDEADTRLNAGKALGKIETQIAEAQNEVAEINNLIDELGVAANPRPEAAIVQDLQDVLSTQRQLGGRLRAAQRAGDADAVARIQRDIETARAWSAALKYERSTGKVVSDEGADLLVAGQDEITKLRAQIQQSKAEAEALGNDQVAMVYAALDERLPVWDASTQTLTPAPGVQWDGVWYHGTPEGGSMASAVHDPSGAGHIDNANGMHVTTSWSAANRYADKLEQGLTGDVAAFDLAIAPNEVLTYSTPYDVMEMMNPNDSQFDRLWKFGSPWGDTKARILDDNFKHAIREGIMDVDDVMEAIAGSYIHMSADVRQAIEEGWDDLYDAMDEVLDDVAGGESFMESLATRFEGTDLDPYHGQEMPEGLGEPHWTRAGNRIMHQIQEGMGDTLKKEIGTAWRDRMLESGRKGVFYDHLYGGQEFILFDQGAARLTESSPRAFKMADDVKAEMKKIITQKAEAAQRTAASYDGPIVDARLDYEGAATRAMQADERLHKVESALADQRSTISAKVRASLEEEADYLRRASEARKQADLVQQTYVEEQQMKAALLGEAYDAKVVDEDRIAVHNNRQVATLEADYQQALAEVTKWERSGKRWDGKFDTLQGKHAEQAIDTALDRGLKMFGASTLLPEDMTEVLTAATRLREPGWSKNVLGTFDYVQNLWKGYATMSPGFVFRNIFGGIFNNALAGIERRAYQDFLTAAKRGGSGKGIVDEAYRAAVEAGVLTGGQSVAEVAFRRGHLGALKRLNPLKPEFGPIAAVRAGSHKAEEFLRGSLFMDVYRKTEGNVDAAIAAVNKYHFDYDDLSAIERSVFRRVVPFYTWTRKNFPLQLEMLARNPKVYNRYTQAKHNMEVLSDEEGTVPGYFGDNFSIRLPWRREGGNVYYMPDLPFTNMMEMTNPGQALANTSPLIKTPIELWAGKQMWQDIPFNDKHVPVSPVMAAVPGLMPALQAAGWATHNAAGDWVMKDRHMYAVTSFLPTLAQARRLVPAEDKYQQRALTSWLSFLGAGMRTNTAAEQANQQWGRYYSLKDRLALLEDLGYVGQSQRLDAEAKYGARDTTDQRAPLDAAARLLDGYERTSEDEEKLAFSS